MFLEAVDAESSDSLPILRVVDDPARLETYDSWLDNDSARWALDLYGEALRVSGERGADGAQPDLLPIALVPGGNHAAIGFRLLRPTGRIEERPRAAYVKLGPDDWRFSTTLLHETGHVVLAILNGGRPVPVRPIAAITHSTAALTDRGTAFDEGFAIHLETLAAHLATEAELKNRYRHQQMLFGVWPGYLAEYYRSAADLLTFSQTVARYAEVRDNGFAFESAFTGPDYHRVQLEKERDFASLRDANQLLQSEGFYASFFFAVLARGKSLPAETEIRARLRRTLEAVADGLGARPVDAETPFLLRVLEGFSKADPDGFAEVLDVFLDLSHGVFVDPAATRLWRDFYLASLRLDLERIDRESLEATREAWREAARDPARLRSRLGPQIRCVVESVRVETPALGEPTPLSFDANTAQRGVLRLVPGLQEADVDRWLGERGRAPFTDASDLFGRLGLGEATKESIDCEPTPRGG